MLMELPVLPVPYSDPVPTRRHGLRKAVEGRCFYGGRPFTRNSRTTLDLVIPCNKGGTDCRENLKLCCRPCNVAKADLTPAEWLQRLEYAVKRVRSLTADPAVIEPEAVLALAGEWSFSPMAKPECQAAWYRRRLIQMPAKPIAKRSIELGSGTVEKKLCIREVRPPRWSSSSDHLLRSTTTSYSSS
jgi:HNH endonuclease